MTTQTAAAVSVDAITDPAEAWAPCLTMSESPRLVAQAFTRDVYRLSCCAA